MRISLFSLVLILLVGCKPQALETQVSVVQKAALGVASSARPSSPTSGPATDIQSRLVKRYAATYDYDSLISEPELKLKLQELLDSDYQRFAENMSHMKFPVDVISGNLSVVGRRKKDEYSWDEAVLCVSFHPLAVHVGMYSDSQMVIYSKQAEYRFLPRCLQQWVFGHTTDMTSFSFPPKEGGGEFSFQHKVVSAQ